MKKLLKIAAVLGAAAVLLVAALAVAVKVFFPPEKIKTLLAAEAEKSLNRKVEVRAVSLGLLQGLKVEGVRVSEKPDFSKGEFVKADAFAFRFEWLPLLRKKFVVKELSLEGLTVSVRKDKKGALNFSDLTASPEKAGAGTLAAPAAIPLALQADVIRLKSALFLYDDPSAKTRVEVRVQEAAVKDFKLSGPFSISIRASADARSGSDRYEASFGAKGTVDLAGLEPAKLKADLADFSIESKGLRLSGTLKAENADAPLIEGTLRLPAMDSKALKALSPSSGLPDGLQIPESRIDYVLAYKPPALYVQSFKITAAGAELSGKAECPDLGAKAPRLKLEMASNEFEIAPLMDALPSTRKKGVSGKASLKLAAEGTSDAPMLKSAEFRLDMPGLESKALKALMADPKTGQNPVPDGIRVPALSLKLALSGTLDSLDMKSAEMKIAGITVKGSGAVTGLRGKDPAIRLSAETNRFKLEDLGGLYDEAKKWSLEGASKLKADVSGTLSKPKVEGTLDLAEAGASYMLQNLEQVKGRLRFTEDSVDIPALTGRLNGGDFHLKFAVSGFAAPDLRLEAKLTVLDLGTLEKLMGPPQPEVAKTGIPKAPPYTGPILKTSGNVTVDKIVHPNLSASSAEMDWNLTGVTPEYKLMDGNAKFKVGAGKATDLLKAAKQRGGIFKALVAPLKAADKARGMNLGGFKVPSLNDIPFDRVEGEFPVRKGVLGMQPFLLEGPVLSMTTRGDADLPAETVDLKVNLRLPGSGSVDILVKGPMADPTIRPDLSKEVEKVKEKGKELLKEKGKDFLKKFLK